MEPTALFAPLLLIAVVAWVVFDVRKPNSLVRHLEHELRQHLPVFSADTVRGGEVEFVCDRLPRKPALTLLVVLGAFGVMVVLAWWVAR